MKLTIRQQACNKWLEANPLYRSLPANPELVWNAGAEWHHEHVIKVIDSYMANMKRMGNQPAQMLLNELKDQIELLK